jgi:hypothetical protein
MTWRSWELKQDTLRLKNRDMKKFKVLNLYACLGGNHYKWDEVAK